MQLLLFFRYSYGLDADQCYNATLNAVGVETASNNFVSATVNGMGESRVASWVEKLFIEA